jgi:hypothetical protein
VNLQPGQHTKWAEIKAKVRGWAEEYGLQVYSIQPVVEKAKGTAKRSVRSARSDEEVLRSYVKAKAVDDKTAEVGLKLLQEG